MPIGYYFIDKIVSAETFSHNHPEFAENKTEFPKPAMSETAAFGKILFNSKCASCHRVIGIIDGPGLFGFEERGPWSDRNKLYEWVRNPVKFMKSDPYTKSLKERYGSMMQSFTDIKKGEVDAIVDYINYTGQLKGYPVR